MRFTRVLSFGLPAFLFRAPCTFRRKPIGSVLITFHIGGEGGWDYVTVDPADPSRSLSRAARIPRPSTAPPAKFWATFLARFARMARHLFPRRTADSSPTAAAAAPL